MEELLRKGYAVLISHRGSISFKEAVDLASAEANLRQFPMAVCCGMVDRQDWQVYGLAWDKVGAFDQELVIYPQIPMVL